MHSMISYPVAGRPQAEAGKERHVFFPLVVACALVSLTLVSGPGVQAANQLSPFHFGPNSATSGR